MRHLLDHATKAGRVGPFHHTIDFMKPQRLHNVLVLRRRADDAAHQLDFDFAFGHVTVPLCRYSFSMGSPRISAMAFLSHNCSSAAMVAFTTLCALCDPIDLVSTFGIPTA